MVNFPFLKTLILTDSITNYSKLAASIGPYDLSGDLVSFNKLNYQNLFILSPSTLAPSQKDILDFVNLGGNVVVSCNENSAPSIREFAYEFGVDFDNLHSVVKDPFNNGSFKNSIETSKYVGNKYALFSRGIAPKTLPKLLFSGLPHRLTGKNPLAQALIVAEDSAYSFAEKGSAQIEPTTPFIGSRITLVSAVQTRANSRLLFTGSSSMFSDAFLETKSSNLQILTELVKWTFQSKAVLRATNFQHNRLGEYTQHGIYRIKDKMQVSIKVQEFSDGKWSDFITDDLQFNAIMLDPYVRKTMICKNGTYSVDWQLPDVYGVFTFSINYKRHGLSWIEAKDIVQVRPFRHDDYERFIFSAWPYYINVGSMIVAFLVVSSVWVFDRDVVKKEE